MLSRMTALMGGNRAAHGASAPAILPIGATFGIVGDGLVATSGGVGSGLPNYGHQLERLMGGRIQPVALPILGKSGTRIATSSGSQYAWVNPYAIDALIKQRPNIFIFGACGHNEGVMSTDPTTSPAMVDWKAAVSYAYTSFVAYAALNDVFVVALPSYSDVGGESTHRAAATAACIAHVATLQGDTRVVLADTSFMLPASDYSVDSGSSNTHYDERGAYAVTSTIATAIDSKVEAATLDTVLNAIFAGTYPLMLGSQLDTDRDLAGTAGTMTGPDVSGSVATSKAIVNSTGSASISCAMQVMSGSRNKIVLTMAGTASAAGKIMVSDKNNITVTASPGQYVRTGCRLKASAGFHNFGADWGNFASIGGSGGSLANNANVGAAEAHAMDSVLMGNELPLYANNTSFATKRNWAILWRSGAALSGTVELSDPFYYLVSERLRVPAAYLGDLRDANNAVFLNTNYRMRPSGAVSQASGGSPRAEVGAWVPRGLLHTDFTERRLYKGTSGDTAIGSGTLIGTISGATWAFTIGAGVVTTGDKIHLEVDVLCPITGLTRTGRSLAGDAVTAT